MATRILNVSPIIGVSNVREAAEYYRDVLGFSLDPVDGVFQPVGGDPGGAYAIVKFGDAWIHFQFRPSTDAKKERSPLERDLYLYVENLTEFHTELVKRGANIIQEPFDAPYGIRELVIEDLNKYRISFGQVN